MNELVSELYYLMFDAYLKTKIDANFSTNFISVLALH